MTPSGTVFPPGRRKESARERAKAPRRLVAS
jgi:hypothetical protein